MNLKLEDNDFFIGAINHEGGDELLVNLVIEDSHTEKVKLDTGPQVNVMPLALYKALGKDPKKLKPTNTNLTAYGGNKIEVLGCCHFKSRSGLPDCMNKLAKLLTMLFVFHCICLLFS